MRYLMLFRPADTKQFEAGAPPAPEMIARMGDLIQRKIADGKLLATEGCGPTSHGALVSYSKGKLNVTDGPFSEAKEIIGGFALFRLNSKHEAISEAREFLEIAGEGTVEIRPIFDEPKVID
jgi:hypothetical protein